MINKRNYEVSLWTLQDSFITVLKPFNLEYRGQLLDPMMTLKDDGTNNLSFKIPMYIQDEKGNFIENPIWYNVINGSLISNLRKIKVICNKFTNVEEVFEFVILKVQENHEGKKKYCQVECEGLAFHELGRQGYKISLDGQTEIDIEQKAWFEGKRIGIYQSMPHMTINYWADRVFKNSNWRYSIQMDWSSYDGITHQTYTLPNGTVLDSDNYSSFSENDKNNFNFKREQDGLRRRDKVYDEDYINSWQIVDDNLIPKTIVTGEEKYVPISAKESNRYNLSQTIAEQFQVYCKYKYYYDNNYHIIDREAIFYNNFLKESEGIIDLTYEYDTENLSRKMEGSDLITKMFVRTLNNKSTASGDISITSSPANKSGEDYILNFDYLYNIGTISKDQYDAIEEYEKQIHELNEQIDQYTENLFLKEKARSKKTAIIKTADDEINEDWKRIEEATSYIREYSLNEDGTIPITEVNPLTLYVLTNRTVQPNIYYCDIDIKGVKPETLKLYNTYSARDGVLSDPISNYNLVTDDANNLIQITFSAKPGGENLSLIYATCDYIPYTYHNNIIQMCNNRISKNTTKKNTAQYELDQINTDIETYNTNRDAAVANKDKIINDFEALMGPALREGYWQPEDDYASYSEIHNDILTLSNTSLLNNNLISLGWDDVLFDEEASCTFDYGYDVETYYYPCIDLRPLLNYYNSNQANFWTDLTFVYQLKKTESATDKSYIRINSQMELGFIRGSNSTETIPVLILIGIKTTPKFDEDGIVKISEGYLTFTTISSSGITENGKQSVTWVIAPGTKITEASFKRVYPRFCINSNYVVNYKNEIYIKSGNVSYENYEDFSIFLRENGCYITLKPSIIFSTNFNNWNNRQFEIQYQISTAATAIYLDAQDVLKENSQPKVSYDITVMNINQDLIYDTYHRLGQIAHINDYEFKFQNVMGYVSEVNLDLERPWQDKIIIKNYKTKFEDLFSKIVAQTAQMKKNALDIGYAISAFNNDGTIKESLISETVENLINLHATPTTSVLSQYLQYEPYIRSLLQDVYNEAGEVLSEAQKSVNDLNALNLRNSQILNLFKTDVRDNLTPTTFRLGTFGADTYSVRHNMTKDIDSNYFKIGDYLEYAHNGIIDTYMATSNSSQVSYEINENHGTSLKGWSQVQNNSLSQIKGAALDIDTKAGVISLKAQNNISVLSGGSLNLAAGNVKIIGNNNVQIGGPDIYIYSVSANDYKGIHLYTSVIDTANATSTVDITGQGIVMKAANGIRMESGGGINFISNNGDTQTTAMSLSADNGIYLGSNQTITMYSGAVGSSASVEINNDRILFGVSGRHGTAVEVTDQYFIIGSASVVTSNDTASKNAIGAYDGSAGVKITENSIQLATGTEGTSTRNYISMDSTGIKIANANNKTNGSVVEINEEGILVGTAPEQGQTSQFIRDILNGTSTSGYSGAYFQVYAPNFVVDKTGTLYANGAHISGDIVANSLSTGDRTSSSAANGTYIDSNGAIYVGPHNEFTVTKDGVVTASSINASGGSISAWSIDGNGIHIWQDGILSGMFTQAWNNGDPNGTNGFKNPLNRYFFMAGSNSFYVTYGGYLYAQNANIQGTITSSTISGGTISGATITSTASNSKITISNGCITLDGNWTSSASQEGGITIDFSFNAMKFLFDTNYFYMKNDGITVIQVPIYSSITGIPDVDIVLDLDLDDITLDLDPPDFYNMSAPNKDINLNNVPHFNGYANSSKRANIANYADKVYSNSDMGTQVIAIGTSNWANTGIYNGNGDGDGNGTANLIISSWNGVGFRNGCINAGVYDKVTAGVNCRNGTFYGSAFSNTSSYLVKENIKNISDNLAKKLLLTRPIIFDYKKDHNGLKNQFGLIAEELEEIIPELVIQPEMENDYKSIDYSKFVPLLIKLAQNQQKEIDDLKEQLQKLK